MWLRMWPFEARVALVQVGRTRRSPPLHDPSSCPPRALGLEEDRSADRWVDWNFYGHQVETHVAERATQPVHNPVDGYDVPVPHFGLVLSVPEFCALADKLRAAGTEFVIEPYQRFAGQPGEQWTMFFRNPAGNAMEVMARDKHCDAPMPHFMVPRYYRVVDELPVTPCGKVRKTELRDQGRGDAWDAHAAGFKPTRHA
jgi:extradiol dioxygenase family protein